MKIALVINDITGLGGAERVVTLLANNLSSIGFFEVEILSVFSKRNAVIGFELDEKVKINYLFPQGITGNLFFKWIRVIKKMRAFYKKGKFDFVINCSAMLSIVSLLATIINSKSKIISWEHTQHSHLSGNTNRLQRIFYPFLSGVVTLTQFDKIIFSKFCKKVAFIPNISTFEEVPFNNLNSKKIIAVGRLNYAKGFDLLINSFDEVHKHNPEWTLDIFGEGNLFEDLTIQINKLKLEHVIHLKGYESNILNQYQNASIFVLSSRTEGFPCVLVEAMSAGLPSVNFELPGFNEVVINNKNGLLIEPNNCKELATGINTLIENIDLRLELGKNAKKSVKQFQGESIIPKWLIFFKEINC